MQLPDDACPWLYQAVISLACDGSLLLSIDGAEHPEDRAAVALMLRTAADVIERRAPCAILRLPDD